VTPHVSSLALSTRPDYGSRASQQQAVLRSYAGNRAEAVAEPARTTDTTRPGGGGSAAPEAVDGSVLSYLKSGRSLRLSLAGESLGRGLDIRV
jgi:hypothetical protein